MHTGVEKMMLLLLMTSCLFTTTAFAEAPILLSGEWGFRLDPANAGVEAGWFKATLPDQADLPGSTDENGYGTPNLRPPDFNYLSRLVEYTGAAWHQKDIQIPEEWAGKRVTLFLERCHWETRAWFDETETGMRDSLCTPHVYTLTNDAIPGSHRITLRIDNAIKYNVGKDAHSITEQTQTNWNGAIGQIELRATDPIWIDAVQVYPDLERRTAKVCVRIGNVTGMAAEGALQLRAFPQNAPSGVEQTLPAVAIPVDGANAETEIALGDGFPVWDEFNPVLIKLETALRANAAEHAYVDNASTQFGLRKIDTASTNKHIRLNGRPIYLRGTLECCIFPLTGYPSMDVAAWQRIIGIAKSYGLNHLRFHSWCPPEAAFTAADEAGFIFHVEAPQWVFDIGKDAPRDAFIAEEVKHILDTYGNHPSFGMLCMGNELQGEPQAFSDLVKMAQAHDPRHLYSSSTAWSHVPENDYNVSHKYRGLHGVSTDQDFEAGVAQSPVPEIAHEIGQWTFYPDFEEMPKYTGVLRPRNFARVRDDLAAKGMQDQASALFQTSGQLAWRLYKEEIEVQLRTPSRAGFQLLDLHDFPGQGTALIGILDPFWDSKGFITSEAFRRFCGPIVPLARLPKRTYTLGETLTAQVDLAQYGPGDLGAVEAAWRLTTQAGHVMAKGVLPAVSAPTGAVTRLGQITAPLTGVDVPVKCTLTVEAGGGANDWDLWVYPPPSTLEPPSGILVTKTWNDETVAALNDGKTVLLFADTATLAQSRPGSFTPVFWSPVWFSGAGAGTMSIVCDPKHPALAAFPTDAFTDWQWSDLLDHSRSMVLNELPLGFHPIVQVGDNFSRNDRLGNLFEANVAKGRLLVCSIDVWTDLEQRPAACQFLRGLYAYIASPDFQPAQSITVSALTPLFRDPEAFKRAHRAPASFDQAVLHVRAARNAATLNQAEEWKPTRDDVVKRAEGFNYKVHGGVWKDETGAAWHDGGNLSVTIRCPKGFTGVLYAHFHDWNRLGRTAEITLNDASMGILENYESGVWLSFPLSATDTASGEINLAAHPLHANAMITEILLEPKP